MFIKIILGLTSKNHQCQIQILPQNSSPALSSTTYINKSESHISDSNDSFSLYKNKVDGEVVELSSIGSPL